MFERRKRNGEVVKRSWLCFSPANGRVYCFFCKLMGVSRSQFTSDGFCDWKHANRLVVHEQSKDHIQAVLSAASRAKGAGGIDSKLTTHVGQIEQYLCSLLKRLISVLKFICERGRALRGDDEVIGSPHNGNYLGLLELLAEYDDFLRQHIQNHANRGTGHTNYLYLSSTICEEIVRLMGNEVLNEIISRIKLSKYYSISLDSTPDEGHIDELTLIIRFMEHDTPVERFVKFLPIEGHKAQEMFKGLLKFFADNDIDIQNCRGQSYDNATSMSGRYNGLQAKVVAENHHAIWIPCAASTHRYAILSDLLKTVASGPVSVPKRISTTRWSCRAVEVKAVVQGYLPIREALAKIARDENETSKTCYKANGLHDKMCKLETAIYAVLWHDILGRDDATSHALQDPKLDLNTAVAMLKSLECFVREKRDCFHVYEKKGREMSETGDYSQTRKRQRNVRLNPLDYGRSEEAALSQSEKFRVQNFLPVIDQFLSSLDQRLKAYEETCSLFGFLSKLESMNCDEIEAAAAKLVAQYKNDLDQTLGVELVQFTAFFTLFLEDEDDEKGRAHYLYKLLIDKKVVDTFPNVEIILLLYLVLMVTNCSGERLQ
ncbi:zinc finger MYM-type protein 1-like [Homarus americanus]|uniref:zinc finger MYM-type protein 1-like n=1 Tax=Homarus americanus TaxID=6706 RepID=UPI001C445293|nr:zinc finger MYM-type protein 1-like [Homarus americanus]